MDVLSFFCHLQGFLDQSEVDCSGAMAVPRLLPFKAKVEEITSKLEEAKPAEGPAKRQCNAYEKQIQGMDGDVSLVKDCVFIKGWESVSRNLQVFWGNMYHLVLV